MFKWKKDYDYIEKELPFINILGGNLLQNNIILNSAVIVKCFILFEMFYS